MSGLTKYNREKAASSILKMFRKSSSHLLKLKQLGFLTFQFIRTRRLVERHARAISLLANVDVMPLSGDPSKHVAGEYLYVQDLSESISNYVPKRFYSRTGPKTM